MLRKGHVNRMVGGAEGGGSSAPGRKEGISGMSCSLGHKEVTMGRRKEAGSPLSLVS